MVGAVFFICLIIENYTFQKEAIETKTAHLQYYVFWVIYLLNGFYPIKLLSINKMIDYNV